jgi:hypothetical protein
MSGTLVVLPPELHDIIIGFLYNDIHTLASCALVCKDWLPSCRCHLFRQLELEPRTAQKFLPLLESPLHGPAIAPYVRHLYILEGVDHWADLLGPWLDEGLLRMGVLRSVTSLIVSRLYWKNLSGESYAAFLSFLHTVEELHFSFSEFQSFDQFTEVVCKPRSLRKLELVRSGWEDGPTVGLDRLPCPRQLQALRLDEHEDLLRWLLQHESCRTLKIIKVDFRRMEAQSIDLFGQLLRALGSTLESFNVRVRDR